MWFGTDDRSPLRPAGGAAAPRPSANGKRARLVPVPHGRAYRLDSPPEHGLVRPELASELQRVLERFAREAGSSERTPVRITFRPGVVGHHQAGRAADIYAVGGIGLERWKKQWDDAVSRAERASMPEEGQQVLAGERKRNLGWRLYKAIQFHGRWAQPYGYPIQLFGPWTRSEGPWKFISDRLLHAHRDHIHVAK